MKNVLLKDTNLPTRLKNSIYYGFIKNRNRFKRTGKKNHTDIRNEITLADVGCVPCNEWRLAFRNFGKASQAKLWQCLSEHGISIAIDELVGKTKFKNGKAEFAYNHTCHNCGCKTQIQINIEGYEN